MALYMIFTMRHSGHGPPTRYVQLRVAHAPGMPGTFSPPPRLGDPDMHHGTCVTHVPWCMPGSLTSGFHSNRWRGKRSRHSRRMRKPQFYVSGKRPMCWSLFVCHWALHAVCFISTIWSWCIIVFTLKGAGSGSKYPRKLLSKASLNDLSWITCFLM